MIVLKILGIAVAVILLLIAIILLLPSRIIVRFDEKGDIYLYLKVLGYPLIAEYPGKEKKEEGLVKEVTDRIKKATGTSRLTDVKTLKDILAHGGISETLSEELRIIAALLREVARLLPQCKLCKLKLKAVFSSDDPAEEAMDYGIACALVYPFIAFVKDFMRVSERGLQTDMRCSFGTEKATVFFEAVIGTPVFRLVGVLVRLIIEETKNAIRQEGIE